MRLFPKQNFYTPLLIKTVNSLIEICTEVVLLTQDDGGDVKNVSTNLEQREDNIKDFSLLMFHLIVDFNYYLAQSTMTGSNF